MMIWSKPPWKAAWTSLDVPMPYSKPLPHEVVPNVERVIMSIKEAMYFNQ